MGDTTTTGAHRAARPGATRRAALAGTAAVACLVLLTLPAAPAGGQEVPEGTGTHPDPAAGASDGGASGVIVDVGVGLLTPLANLAPTAPPTAVDREPAPSLSVAVSASANAVYLFTPKLGVGVHGAWSNADVDVERVLGGGDGDDGDSRRRGSADFLAGSAELVYRPLGRPRGTSLDPYLAAGGGVRHLSFSDARLEDETGPMGTVAGGVRTEVIGPLFWTTEVRGFFSTADPTDRGSRIQTDVVVSVGLGAGL